MGLGILDDHHLHHVPGTTRYFDRSNGDVSPIAGGADIGGGRASEIRPLKRTHDAEPIILVPQPSDDPNDPLNWSLRKRDRILAILSIVTIFATSLGPILAANTVTLSDVYRCTFTDTALLTGYFLMGVGVGGFFVIPTSRIWGKRHMFILGTIIVIFASAWGGASRSYGSMLAARIVQGLGVAPFESLVNAVIGDLYFVHQRGKRMALVNLAVFGGSFFTPILVGKITYSIGWWWSFYFVSIFTGACLPLIILFVPETTYVRSAVLNTDLVASGDAPGHAGDEKAVFVRESRPSRDGLHTSGQESASSVDHYGQNPSSSPSSLEQRDTRQMSYKQSLRLFTGRKSNESLWKLILRPLPLFLQPAIFWACLIQCLLIGWAVFIGIILAVIMIGPPLFWTEVKTGYAYTGAFIGAILGFLVAALLADWSAKYMTRRNGGIYEPEFRIVLVIPQLIVACVGLFGFGVTANELINYSWVCPVFFFGCVVMGMVIGSVASALYILDAYRDLAIEAFTCLLIFKNFFSFGLTFAAYDWLVDGGTLDTFMAIGGLQVAVSLLSIPMYIYGKRNRSFFHRHDLLRLTGLR